MIWQSCDGAAHIAPISGQLYRLVESQQQVATMGYVDTLAEQALLESMLDEAKPPYPEDFTDYHYLLKTPFRYPPLKWGSRFGRPHEKGMFYAGLSAHTTLAECAYYRFVFLDSMQPPAKPASIRTEHTMISVGYKTRLGVRLHEPPFDSHSAALTHTSAYGDTQQLGSAMREAGVQAFEYTSARDPDAGHCAALFSAAAFAQRSPTESRQWLCELAADRVSYKQIGETAVVHFSRSMFLADGALPMPAA